VEKAGTHSWPTILAAVVALGMAVSAMFGPSKVASKTPCTPFVDEADPADPVSDIVALQTDPTLAESAIKVNATPKIAHGHDSPHEPVAKSARPTIITTASSAPLPRDSEPYRAARSLLPANFLEYETRRFIVLSDTRSDEARRLAENLERAHHQFHRIAGRLGLDPAPLRHKLVCVLFQDHRDYVEFAARHDNVNSRWVAGYYSPRFDRIVFYNVGSAASVNDAHERLAEMREEIETLRRSEVEARRAGDRNAATRINEQLREYEQHMNEQRRRLDRFTVETMTATTMHEAMHQLAFHTLVQHPRVHYPIWISEGLATSFETDAPNRAFGPDHESPHRRERFDRLLDEDRLLPLRDLVKIADLEEDGEERLPVVYHQSYALIAWMYRFRANELGMYLRAMQNAPQRPLTATEHVDFFQEAFGDIDQLERAWLRHEQSRR
jgi:hypothetical protein